MRSVCRPAHSMHSPHTCGAFVVHRRSTRSFLRAHQFQRHAPPPCTHGRICHHPSSEQKHPVAREGCVQLSMYPGGQPIRSQPRDPLPLFAQLVRRLDQLLRNARHVLIFWRGIVAAGLAERDIRAWAVEDLPQEFHLRDVHRPVIHAQIVNEALNPPCLEPCTLCGIRLVEADGCRWHAERRCPCAPHELQLFAGHQHVAVALRVATVAKADQIRHHVLGQARHSEGAIGSTLEVVRVVEADHGERVRIREVVLSDDHPDHFVACRFVRGRASFLRLRDRRDEFLPLAIALRLLQHGDVAERDRPYRVDTAEGRAVVVSAAKKLPQIPLDVRRVGAIGVRRDPRQAILDKDDPLIEHRPAAADRPRCHVAEVVLLAPRQLRGHERPQLGREDGTGVRARHNDVRLLCRRIELHALLLALPEDHVLKLIRLADGVVIRRGRWCAGRRGEGRLGRRVVAHGN
mmetsp:Transcript_23366/g.68616  ORF Transcript_23366/g.68616 Transcript_23366/m.68616 type:complete len:461 (-) Transcript_23366:778-2160(-)